MGHELLKSPFGWGESRSWQCGGVNAIREARILIARKPVARKLIPTQLVLAGDD